MSAGLEKVRSTQGNVRLGRKPGGVRRLSLRVESDDAQIRELMLVKLFAVFSERDPERRLKVIAANYTEDVIWSDAEATTHGHEACSSGDWTPRTRGPSRQSGEALAGGAGARVC
jgi:hypothetical protein